MADQTAKHVSRLAQIVDSILWELDRNADVLNLSARNLQQFRMDIDELLMDIETPPAPDQKTDGE